jgi:molybdopterin synthase catalytic subunit
VETIVPSELFEIRDTPISVGEVVDSVGSRECGAIASFIGTVRCHNEGREVTLLQYEAYQSMAEKQMKRIAEQLPASCRRRSRS